MSRTKWIILLILTISTIILVWGLFQNRTSTDGFSRKNTDKKLRSNATEVRGTNATPIYIIDNFLTDSECDAVMASISDELSPSPLTRQDPNDANFRTSTTAYFSKNPLHDRIDGRIVNIIGIYGSKYSEIPQVQNYDVGNEFKAHWDFFDPSADKSFYDKGQRTWTFMVYLTDVEEGGETYFTKLKNSITPKKGRAVIWCNLQENGDIDRNTMHQGSPVKKGKKGIITKWFKLEDNRELKL